MKGLKKLGKISRSAKRNKRRKIGPVVLLSLINDPSEGLDDVREPSRTESLYFCKIKSNDTNKDRTQGGTSQSSEDTIEEERRSPPLVIPEHCEDDAQSFSTTSTRSDLVGPGRALGVLYSKAGRILERTANSLAHKMGFGPYAIYLRILDSTEFWSACKVLHPLLTDGGRRKVWPVVRSGYDKMLNYAL